MGGVHRGAYDAGGGGGRHGNACIADQVMHHIEAAVRLRRMRTDGRLRLEAAKRWKPVAAAFCVDLFEFKVSHGTFSVGRSRAIF